MRWSGKVALVTGASSGIGASIVSGLLGQGVNVVGLARRLPRLQELADKVKNSKGQLYTLKADITKEEDIIEAFKWTSSNVGAVQVLVNNAGICNFGDTIDTNVKDWRNMFDVNVIGLGVCVREFLKHLRSKGIDDGHIVNINSIVGQKVVEFPKIYCYGATKHALNVINEGIKRELLDAKSRIKVTSICPGYVDTELFFQAKGQPKKILEDSVSLKPEDVSRSVLFAIDQPSDVQISQVIVQGVGETF